jgi:hypothetical protein
LGESVRGSAVGLLVGSGDVLVLTVSQESLGMTKQILL